MFIVECNGGEILRMCQEKNLIKRCRATYIFATMHRQLCETGLFDVYKSDSGRRRTIQTVFVQKIVLQELKRNLLIRRETE